MKDFFSISDPKQKTSQANDNGFRNYNNYNTSNTVHTSQALSNNNNYQQRRLNNDPPTMPQPAPIRNNNPIDNSNDGTSNPIVCSCSNPAAFFTVRKEGKNQGRKFYVCSSKTCDFFLWADAVTSNNNDDNDAPSNNFSNRNNSNSRSQPAKSNSNNSDNKCPTCGISLTL